MSAGEFSLLLPKWWIRGRPGALKWWGDFPVRVTWQVLQDIDAAFSELSGDHEIHSHGRALDDLDDLRVDPRYQRVKHVAFFTPRGNLYLGPRAIYLFRETSWPEDRALIQRVAQILHGARRSVGTLLLRLWGSVLLVSASVGGTALGFGDPSASRAWTIATAAWIAVVVLFATDYVGLVARVRFELPHYDRRTQHPGLVSLLAITTIGTIIATLVATVVMRLLGWTEP